MSRKKETVGGPLKFMHPRYKWTLEVEEQAKHLRLVEKKSAADIARALGLRYTVVASKLNSSSCDWGGPLQKEEVVEKPVVPTRAEIQRGPLPAGHPTSLGLLNSLLSPENKIEEYPFPVYLDGVGNTRNYGMKIGSILRERAYEK